MARIAWVADVHLGNHRRFGGPMVGSINRRCRQTLDAFGAAARAAIKGGCSHFVVAGDLFDYARPEAPLIAAVQEILRMLLAHKCMPVLLLGNHEFISTEGADHALAPLAGLAKIVDLPGTHVLGDARVWFLPHVVDPAVNHLPGSPPASGFLLCMHAGVEDDKTPPWLCGSHDAIDIDVLEVGQVFTIAGNWHDAREWGTHPASPVSPVVQLGALVPTGWDNPGLEGYGRVLFLDTKEGHLAGMSQTWIDGPRFVTVRSRGEFLSLPASDKLYVRWEAAAADVERATILLGTRRDHGQICDGEIVVCGEEAAAAVASAVALANEVGGIGAALDAHVACLTLTQEEYRPHVLAACRRHLGI